ncbi:hypothetical protein XBP1_2230010 [Xenorhabdus bovienii str. puntauvense]|uniref:Uncharacterized protein n=2 Tax=Xenorhabdus bovienii TaxID=40576 RepID=A0A077NCZ8_XENBV|nr:hypothetical protein [Xenorhabdus bovienii]CDG96764.1 hypothetical protein XBP1_2230010 [Xenorhabdus bovienii str. puntauvense]CDH23211.1 hypothetical protein XBKB1_1560015 [Xenorhabdus bovienii str. kraussei Becker Underwood]
MSNYRSVIANGIVTLYYKPEDSSQENIVISLPATTILDRVNGGDWDEQPLIGIQLLMAWLKTFSTVQRSIDDIRFFRWMVAHVWVTEQTRVNHGKPIFTLEDSPIALPISLATTRVALANNIEGALIERFGHEQGIENAMIFYQEMMAPSPEYGLALSDFGKEVLTTMYRSFIEDGVALMQFNKPEVLH